MKPSIIPATELPIDGMRMQISGRDGILTIEFENAVSWLQFNQADGERFLHGLAAQLHAMKAH